MNHLLEQHESHNHHAYIKNPQGFWVSVKHADQPHHQKNPVHVNFRARIQIDPGVSDGCSAAESIFGWGDRSDYLLL